MNVVHWDGLSPVPLSLAPSVVTIGNFDGVHQGHAALLRRLHRMSESIQRPSLVVTFDPSPTTILRPDWTVESLTTMNDRIRLMKRFSLDAVLVLQTSTALLELTAERFWQQLLVRDLRIQGLVEGQNFCFGKDRCGTVEQLQAWSQQAELPCELVDDVYRSGMRISSSAVRQALKQGEVTTASRALGRPYSITGTVIHGEHRGRTIGFPTCNLDAIPTLIPAEGVYAVLAHTGDRLHPAAVNIGPNPTFGESRRKVEAHLLDYQGDLYSQSLTLEFIARLRPTQKFNGIDALKQQLQRDVEQTRLIVRMYQEKLRHVQR